MIILQGAPDPDFRTWDASGLVEKCDLRRMPRKAPTVHADRRELLLLAGCRKNLLLQLRRDEEVGFGAEEIQLWLDGSDLACSLGAKQDSQGACDGEADPRCQLAPLLLVKEHEVRLDFRRQGNRLCLSSMELQQENLEQPGASRRSNLHPIRLHDLLDRCLRNWVGVGRKFSVHCIRYP